MTVGSGLRVSRRRDLHLGYDPLAVVGVGHVHVLNLHISFGDHDMWRGRIDIFFCACFSAFPS